MPKRKTHEEFLREMEIKNPTIIVHGKYKNCSTKIDVECSKCGHVWNTVPNSLVQGHGCPKCANNCIKTQQDFVHEMSEYNSNIEIISQYQKARSPINVKCKICGNEWLTTPSRLLRGAQCMNCVRPHTSFMEQFMLISFRLLLGKDKVETRNTTAIGKELDIYIPSYRIAIEPGTWRYHKTKVTGNDNKKRVLCKEKGIRCITVYDTYPKNISPPFDEDCYVFEGFLNEYGYKRLIRLICDIASELEIYNISLDWKEIADQAYKACHYNAHEEFVKGMEQSAPEIEILEQYKGSNISILVNKKTCNHPAWKGNPYHLLRGVGCPLCGIETSSQKRKRTHEEFLDEIKEIHPTIEALSQYTLMTDRILVRCVKCGHEWTPLAYGLIAGKGCPHCAALLGAKNNKGKTGVKSTETFKEELYHINPSIEILGEYKNNKTKITAKCLQCNHKWDVVPASLINGHGCPKCAKKRRTKGMA